MPTHYRKKANTYLNKECYWAKISLICVDKDGTSVDLDSCDSIRAEGKRDKTDSIGITSGYKAENLSFFYLLTEDKGHSPKAPHH